MLIWVIPHPSCPGEVKQREKKPSPILGTPLNCIVFPSCASIHRPNPGNSRVTLSLAAETQPKLSQIP